MLIAVFFSLFRYRYLTDRREIVHGTYRSRTDRLFSPCVGGSPQGIPQIRNFGPKFWPFDREYLENGKSQRYMSIRA